MQCVARLRHARAHAQLLLLLLAARVSAQGEPPPELKDLDLNNFDDYLTEHESVLVHFWAPWSRKCANFKPQLEKVAAVSEFAESIKHARSDISDKRGYTSYLEKFGVLKLPTLVLFRNGHPEMYSHDAPLSYDGVVRWLKHQTATPALPRGADDISETHFFEQQLQAYEAALRNEEKQKEQVASGISEEERRRRKEFLHPGKAGDAEEPTPTAKPPSPAPEKVDPHAEIAEEGEDEPGDGPPPDEKLAHARLSETDSDHEGAFDGGEAGPEAKGVDAAPAKQARQVGDGLAACGSFEGGVPPVSDADFEGVVLNKAQDVFVLFYKPNEPFCAGNGTAYATYTPPQPTVKRLRMDVSVHKSPFVFEDNELPVLMLFPAADKRPLEFNEGFEEEQLRVFAAEHCGTLAKAAADDKEEM